MLSIGSFITIDYTESEKNMTEKEEKYSKTDATKTKQESKINSTIRDNKKAQKNVQKRNTSIKII